MSPPQLDHRDTPRREDGTAEPAAAAAPEGEAALLSLDAVCERCQDLFSQPSSSYKCAHHSASHHYHRGPVKSVMAGAQSHCPGCRLIGTIVANARSMIVRNNLIRPELDDTRVTAELKELGEMVTSTTGPGFTIQPAARVVNIILDVLPGIAGTIVKTASNDAPPDADKVHGLIVPPTIDIERTKQWLATCRDRHDNCRGHSRSSADGSASAFAPTIRLIDVNARQIVPAMLTDDFAALSYVWGKGTKPLLTAAALPLYAAPGGLDEAKLPRTIAEAMRLARDLGFRHLWVDSLCIVQDDDDDKLRQLPLMAALYEAAALVLVAATGIDAEAGLGGYGRGLPPRTASQVRATVNGVPYITTQGGLIDVLQWTRWDRRGWTYQEAFRSRRALVFTDALVYWSCRDATWREDLDSDRDGGLRIKLGEGGSLWRYAPGGRPHTIGCTPSVFFSNVEHFSRRAFRDSGDALWAYGAILAHQAPRFPPSGFLWAHPYAGMSASLLWKYGHDCLTRHVRGAAKQDCHSIVVRSGDGSAATTRLRVPFPSWSWMSADTGVQFRDSCDASVVCAVEWGHPIKLGGGSTPIYLQYLLQIGAEGAAEAAQQFADADGLLTPAPLTVLSAPGRDAVNVDYGLLLFKAETVQLTVSRVFEHTGDDKCPCRMRPDPGTEATMTYATVRSANGSVLGAVDVPLTFFKDEAESTTGEFLLMSSNAWPRSAADERCHVEPNSGCLQVKHLRGCAHISTHNLMLVEWDKGVAYRRAMLDMGKVVWDGLAPETKAKKTIVLG
ncbi:hypothetical protein SCUCBS95973_006029 [Sporothrix curviconia]|uniref:Heterokaryon incompatibility domain-containing protein n=1 Tax=Sporothrix curviconia TaxID=1260050 RepID=A0ABP0C1Q6_9PEZI